MGFYVGISTTQARNVWHWNRPQEAIIKEIIAQQNHPADAPKARAADGKRYTQS